uniref:PawS-like protein 1a n=1 Tax=Zinnia elegans TaxID=34245 RepID=A0A1V0JB60_ZINEL|nr:PawS-like protein 1a [Zinnia elegans]
MAKLALLLLTFTALVAFFSASAYKTTIITTTTTTYDDNGLLPPILDGLDNPWEQCRSQIAIEKLNHCQMHLTQGVKRPFQQQHEHLKQCCSQLQNVNPQCQCDALNLVFNEARQKADVIKTRLMLIEAYELPNLCSLQLQDCSIAAPRV